MRFRSRTGGDNFCTGSYLGLSPDERRQEENKHLENGVTVTGKTRYAKAGIHHVDNRCGCFGVIETTDEFANEEYFNELADRISDANLVNIGSRKGADRSGNLS